MKKTKFKDRRPKYIRHRPSPFLKDEKIEEWNKQLVIKSIVELNQSGKISLASLGLRYKAKPDFIITNLIGRPSSKKFLYHVSVHFFGSWNLALKASGLKLSRKPHNRFWNKALIIDSIKALSEKDHPLNCKSIWRDRSAKTKKILVKITGKATTGSALHDAARRNFGSWDKALLKSGIDPDDVKEKPFWTEKKIISSIEELQQKKVPLNTRFLGRDLTKKTKEHIKKRIGKARSGRSLYGAAYRQLGSWDRALSKAGIDPKEVRQVDFKWKKNSLARILKILNELEVPINHGSIKHDDSYQTSNLIYNYTGRLESGASLFYRGKKMLGRWDNVLKYSGFKLSEVRKSGSPCMKDKEKITEFIRMFNCHERPLNRSAIAEYTHSMKSLIEENCGSAISGLSMFKMALLLYGSWDSALWAAGLDPSYIRLRSRPGTHANLDSLQQTEDINFNGERRYSNFFGAPPKSPERVIEENESAEVLAKIMEKNKKDKELSNLGLNPV